MGLGNFFESPIFINNNLLKKFSLHQLFLIVELILVLLFLFFITRPLTVLFHELGHAIPALILTREKVTVYLGSYGETKNCWKVSWGLLELWMKPNPFWSRGLCTFTGKDISIRERFIIILLGPLASLFIAIVGAYFIFNLELHGSLKLTIAFFFLSALFDLFQNLIPDEEPLILHNGNVTYNDGYNLKRLIYLNGKFVREYEKGADFYSNQEYEKAYQVFEQILFKRNIATDDIFRVAISSLVLAKKYDVALNLHQNFQEHYQDLSSEDYHQAGFVKSRLGMIEESLSDYELSLKIDPHNLYSLNNKGYTFNLLGRYIDAIPIFNLAIETNPDFAYSFNNRGLSKIKLGLLEDGLADIQHSMELDPDNAYAYMHLGVYYLDQGQKAEAHNLFLKAKEMDSETHGIDEYIKTTINEQVTY